MQFDLPSPLFEGFIFCESSSRLLLIAQPRTANAPAPRLGRSFAFSYALSQAAAVATISLPEQQHQPHGEDAAKDIRCLLEKRPARFAAREFQPKRQ